MGLPDPVFMGEGGGWDMLDWMGLHDLVGVGWGARSDGGWGGCRIWWVECQSRISAASS